MIDLFGKMSFKYEVQLVILATFAITGLTANDGQLFAGKVCYGTGNGMSRTGGILYHYEWMRKRFSGCTFVDGNLEITHLESTGNMTFDLSFLETIEVVTGYVLIFNNDADLVPLTSLVHIRGESLFEFKGNQYALSVLLSYNNGGLQMPSLKEINGNVMMSHWSACFSNTIAWDVLAQGSVTQISEKTAECDECDAACTDEDGIRRCWGPGPLLCQKVNRMECAWFCQNGTCFEEGMLGCCHPECLGCTDGWIDTACEYCRHFNFEGHCISNCPPETFQYKHQCIRLAEYYEAYDDNYT